MSPYLQLVAMEAQNTQLQLHHQIQTITTARRRLNHPRHETKPLTSTFSCPTGSLSSARLRLRLRLPESVSPVVASSKGALESGSVTEEGVVVKEDSEIMEAEEWMELGYDEKLCGERKGIAEKMECLEEEAILGSDLGREPTDYNRRARIFDKSSQVFQALKQRNAAGG